MRILRPGICTSCPGHKSESYLPTICCVEINRQQWNHLTILLSHWLLLALCRTLCHTVSSHCVTLCVWIIRQSSTIKTSSRWSQVQYTTESNQISLTDNNNSEAIKPGPQNQHCCGSLTKCDMFSAIGLQSAKSALMGSSTTAQSDCWWCIRAAEENRNLCQNIHFL